MRVTMTYLCIAATVLFSCNTTMSPSEEKTEFDLPKFFQNEAARLQELNPTVTKTVSNQKSKESKDLKITNWEKELAQFTTIDLNKPGNNDFTKVKKDDIVIYNSGSKNPVTVKIVFKSDTPSEISIYKKSKNLLFTNEEFLHYSMGLTYTIDKRQQVKGMGKNRYLIQGNVHQ